MAHQLSISWLTRVIRKPGFWLILALLVLITLLHYGEALELPAFLTNMISNIGLGRHAFERILYLAPIVWAGFMSGWKGAVITSLAALACMLPRVIFISLHPIARLAGLSSNPRWTGLLPIWGRVSRCLRWTPSASPKRCAIGTCSRCRRCLCWIHPVNRGTCTMGRLDRRCSAPSWATT